MNISSPFIARPVATTLLTIAVVLAGLMAFRTLPVSPLPQVDFPTIAVSAAQAGASPETMAATVAATLERHQAGEHHRDGQQSGRDRAVDEGRGNIHFGLSIEILF